MTCGVFPIQYSTVDKADHKLKVGGVGSGCKLDFRFFLYCTAHKQCKKPATRGMASQHLWTFEIMDISPVGVHSLNQNPVATLSCFYNTNLIIGS